MIRLAIATILGAALAGSVRPETAAARTPPAVNAPLSVNAPRPGAGDGSLCEVAIARIERSAQLPPLLLGAIGRVESGRVEPRTARVAPWPWSINVAGQDRVFETKAEAVAAVQAVQAAGTRSVDVGCMQINLMYHPAAFVSLDEAFDPEANVVYAAGFLNRLFTQAGDWRRAAAAYHSQTPGLGEDYVRRVIASWPLAGRYGYSAADRPEWPDAARAAAPPVDPLARFSHDYTPEFRRRLAQAAADRARRVAQGMAPSVLPPHSNAPPAMPSPHSNAPRANLVRLAGLRSEGVR